MSRVAYFHNDKIGNFYYNKDHPMQPKRIAMAASLVKSFHLSEKLDIYDDRYATR